MEALSVVVFRGLLVAWLGVCVAYDLRTRQVPALLTGLALATAGIFRLTQGGWALVLLVIVLALVSDLPKAKHRLLLGSLAVLAGIVLGARSDLAIPMLLTFAVWVLWEIGALGGADAKMLITLELLFADVSIFLLIILTGGLQGLAGWFARRRTLPYTLSIALGTLAWFWLAGLQQ